MTYRLFAGALFAGLAAGLFATLLQLWLLVPLILDAEALEGAFPHSHESGTEAAHDHAPAAPEGRRGGLDRTIGTLGATLATWTGFALVLVAGLALADRFGRAVDARRGAVWGIAGFIAVALAPAVGLPPELPGSVTAELVPRQAWWACTVGVSVLGLACLAFGGVAAAVAGAVLLALPHAIGAPLAPDTVGTVPADLAARYVATALAVAAACWALLGTLAGAFWQRSV